MLVANFTPKSYMCNLVIYLGSVYLMEMMIIIRIRPRIDWREADPVDF
jgi:hypothetical protein